MLCSSRSLSEIVRRLMVADSKAIGIQKRSLCRRGVQS